MKEKKEFLTFSPSRFPPLRLLLTLYILSGLEETFACTGIFFRSTPVIPHNRSKRDILMFSDCLKLYTQRKTTV